MQEYVNFNCPMQEAHFGVSGPYVKADINEIATCVTGFCVLNERELVLPPHPPGVNINAIQHFIMHDVVFHIIAQAKYINNQVKLLIIQKHITPPKCVMGQSDMALCWLSL